MAFKIYVENNHIVVQDLVSDKEFRAASKEALFFKDRVSEDTYNTNGFFPEGLQGVKFSDIVDENETPFVNEQTFIDFFSTNTGNFNQGGVTPQLNHKEAVINYFIEEGIITTNVINSNLAQLPNVSLVDDPSRGIYLYFTNFGVNTENRLFIDTNKKTYIKNNGVTINKYTQSLDVNDIDGEIFYQSFLNDEPINISNFLNITFKIKIYD